MVYGLVAALELSDMSIQGCYELFGAGCVSGQGEEEAGGLKDQRTPGYIILIFVTVAEILIGYPGIDYFVIKGLENGGVGIHFHDGAVDFKGVHEIPQAFGAFEVETPRQSAYGLSFEIEYGVDGYAMCGVEP